jgi:hypothetical protein
MKFISQLWSVNRRKWPMKNHVIELAGASLRLGAAIPE